MGLFDFFTEKAKKAEEEMATVRQEEDNREVSSGTFALVVEDVFTITGRGTVVTGQVTTGSVSVGDTVYLTQSDTGAERKVTITGIEKFRKTLDTATEGENVGLLLRAVARHEVKRGDLLHK